jgi:hypothetical protein
MGEINGSVCARFRLWNEKGVWQKVFDALSKDRGMENIMTYGSCVRVHQHASGARGAGKACNWPKQGRLYDRGPCDSGWIGKPFEAASGRRGSTRHCACSELLSGLGSERVLADQGHDSNDLVSELEGHGMEVVIPPRSNRKNP